MDASGIIKRIIAGNKEFLKTHDEDYFHSHITEQTPFITLVLCSDSRVQPEVLLPDPINKMFLIKNVGNQIMSNEGSVDYGIFRLKTPVLVILGHSDCGAIKAYMQGYCEETDGIRRELDNLRSLRPAVVDESKPKAFEKALLDNIQKNIDYQVKVACGKYKELIQTGALTVLGALYDFKNDADRGHGRILIVNVNGEVDEKIIKGLPLFEGVEELDVLVGRV